MAGLQGRQRLGNRTGPGLVVAFHRVQHLGRGVGDEGFGQDRVKPDQVQAKADHGGGAVGVLLEDGPGGGGLQVFVARDPDGAQLRRGLADLHRVHMRLIGAHTGFQVRDQGRGAFARLAARRDLLTVFRPAELGDPADEVAQHIGKVLVDRGLEVFPGELAVGVFRRVGEKPPAPVIGGQDRQRLIHEDATALAGGKLAAVIVQVVEALDIVDQLPRLAASHDGGGEGQGVEGDVVLAHELHIANIFCPLVGPPPAFPCRIRISMRVGPFGGGGDVFDRCVEPDIEDLAFHALPWRAVELRGHAPGEVAGDAAILQPVAVVQPFLRDGGGQDRPVGLGVDPLRQIAPERFLFQIEVLGLPHLKLGRAGDGRTRVDEVGRVQLLGAVLALVATGLVIAAVGAGAFDIAVGKETVVGDGKDLLLRHFPDQPVFPQRLGEMLRQPVVAARGGAPEMVEGQAEPGGEIGLYLMHLGAVVGDRHPCLGGCKLGRGAVFVGGADEHHLIAARAHVAGIKIGRKLGTDEVPQMLDPVDIGNRGGDENPGHRRTFLGLCADLTAWRCEGQRGWVWATRCRRRAAS